MSFQIIENDDEFYYFFEFFDYPLFTIMKLFKVNKSLQFTLHQENSIGVLSV